MASSGVMIRDCKLNDQIRAENASLIARGLPPRKLFEDICNVYQNGREVAWLFVKEKSLRLFADVSDADRAEIEAAVRDYCDGLGVVAICPTWTDPITGEENEIDDYS